MGNQLFLCGECIEELFLHRFPCAISSAEPFTLENYALDDLFGRSFLVPREGARTTGLICPADGDLLWTMDQWKCVPLLRRARLEGTELFIYLLNAVDLPPVPGPVPALEEALDLFQFQHDNSELGRCDLHLMFPCSFEGAREDLFQSAPGDEIAAQFIEQLGLTSKEEFSGDRLRLDRQTLGVYYFSFEYPGVPWQKNCQPGSLYLSRHKETQSGSIDLVFPSTCVSALWLLYGFCGDLLSILENGAPRDLAGWMSDHWGVTLYGAARAVLFAYDPLTRYQILKCLAMEPEPAGRLIGPTLRSYAEDDLAQYDIAEVYASTKCLVEIERTCEPDLVQRLRLECVEIYFVELLLLQIASTRRVCHKVLEYMNSEEVLSGEKDYDRLLTLSSEMSSAFLFFDYDYFRFPTVSLACQKISKRFGMDIELKKYEKYRAILEQIIDLAQEERDKIETDNMNLLLLILTIVQVLPTLIETFGMILTGAWSVSILLSWALSIGVCIALCGLFSLYKRHKISSTRRRHKRRT